jgi:hypothetical protein
MARFYQYDELVKREPMPLSDISWIAGQVSQLVPFLEGTAVLCGSVAWGKPSWRSDIDVAAFKKSSSRNITGAINGIINKYDKSTKRRFLIPRADAIIIGAESRRLVTRKNLVRGSTAITEVRTTREAIAATSLRFFDHIGSLAAAKDGPWRVFHTDYLASVSPDRQARREEIRKYASSFADSWRQQPLRSLQLDPSSGADQTQLDAMGYAENFPIHLMRQILAEQGAYPSPDRAPEVRVSFASLGAAWTRDLLGKLDPLLNIGQKYSEIVQACRSVPPEISAGEYYDRLIQLFGTLPFADVEEAVWEYLGSAL